MKKLILLLGSVLTLSAAELTITSEDGFKLYGWLDKPVQTKKKTPVVLFAHQFGSDHTIWNDLSKKFNDKGFATLNIDLRGHGKSTMQNGKTNKVITNTRLDHIKEALVQSDKIIGFENIPSDLSAWIELISEDDTIDAGKLYLFGSSLGGGSILVLLNDYDVKALVALSAGEPKTLRADIDMALGTSMTKTLFIASKNDPLGATGRTIEYGKKAIAGTVIIVSGDGHGTVILPQVEDYIFSFLGI
ncbi:alpha/beta fold hydrolase [bacterium]|nr:alpha/beta fold hydrolase [bacterium]MBU1990364.1 alpha/beta fold hydrolase [bacterium]